MPKSVVELLVCWQGQFGRHRNGHIWMIIPHCRMWCIWRERNSKSFEDTEHFMPDLKFFFFRTLLDWLTALRNLSFFSIVDLLDLCNFCNWLFHPGIIPVYLGDSWYIYFYYLSKRKKKTSNHIQDSLKILSRTLVKCWIPKDSTSKQENLDLLRSYCTLFFLIPVVYIFYFAFHHMTQFHLPSLFGCSVLLRQI